MNEDRKVIENAGTLTTCSLFEARPEAFHETWLITRVSKNIEGVIWTPDLAPSLSLFSAYRTKKIISWPEYERRFREELESQKKKEKMRELWSKLKQGKNICLVCFCPKSDRCHRRIVGEYLAKYGAKVEEQLSRQASLF